MRRTGLPGTAGKALSPRAGPCPFLGRGGRPGSLGSACPAAGQCRLQKASAAAAGGTWRETGH